MASLSSLVILPLILIYLLIPPTLLHPTAAKNRYTPKQHHQQRRLHSLGCNDACKMPQPTSSNKPTPLSKLGSVLSTPTLINSPPTGSGPTCCYTGVYCAPHPKDNTIVTVAIVDLNQGDIAGYLPDELGLLSDLALLHLNSNRFYGSLPQTLSNLSLLYELDLSNNRFAGPFPSVVLCLPSLSYLDIRYNEFEGPLPLQLFEKSLDGIFVNNNRFTSAIPQNLGSSPASAIVFANNRFDGCLPPSIGTSSRSLEELLLINTSISGCLPSGLGSLCNLTVLDVSFNQIVGPLPSNLAGLANLEQLNVAHNNMIGTVEDGICNLPKLGLIDFSHNFFCREEGICSNLTSTKVVFDERRNCFPGKRVQRAEKECEAVPPVDCAKAVRSYDVSSSTAGHVIGVVHRV